MYTKAEQIGLPTSFVDLRHEAAHGEMPGLDLLRRAAEKALKWLWEKYWRNLEANNEKKKAAGERMEEKAAALKRLVGEGVKEEQPGGWTEWRGVWTGTAIGLTP